VKAPASIFEGSLDDASIYSAVSTAISTGFGSNDPVLSSKVYRKALATSSTSIEFKKLSLNENFDTRTLVEKEKLLHNAELSWSQPATKSNASSLGEQLVTSIAELQGENEEMRQLIQMLLVERSDLKTHGVAKEQEVKGLEKDKSEMSLEIVSLKAEWAKEIEIRQARENVIHKLQSELYKKCGDCEMLLTQVRNLSGIVQGISEDLNKNKSAIGSAWDTAFVSLDPQKGPLLEQFHGLPVQGQGGWELPPLSKPILQQDASNPIPPPSSLGYLDHEEYTQLRRPQFPHWKSAPPSIPMSITQGRKQVDTLLVQQY
jgi:hypothetical protein